jgi:DNA modification methylase
MEQTRANNIPVYCRYSEIVDIKDLRPNPNNPNKHPAQQIERLAYIIENNGWRNPIVVSTRSGYIVKGHGRLKAAEKLGVKQVPVEYQDYATESAELADLLADNRIAELAEFDVDAGLKLIDLVDDKALTGFSDKEIADFLGVIETAGDNDAPEIEPEETPDSKPGEIYELGKHRLLCADSTSAESIAAVLQGEKADMIMTDPPYNVDYTGKTKEALKIKGDKRGSEEFYLFLRAAYTAMFSGLKDGGSYYIWHADLESYNFRRALMDAGQQIRQCLIWVKNHMTLGRQDYQWKHESCLYGWKEGGSHYWSGRRDLYTVFENPPEYKDMTKAELLEELKKLHAAFDTSIIHCDKPPASREHPTMKPVELFTTLIFNSSRTGEIILDPFGGSGTSIIAAEKTERACRAIEIDPHYCDIIRRRWTKWALLNGREVGSGGLE